MKQRFITAFVLLGLLAIVVWQVNTPLLVAVVAFLSAVASYEIMKCAKIKNKFIMSVGIIFSAFVQLFASPKVFEPILSGEIWSKVTSFVPGTVYIIAFALILFLAMLRDYAHTKFEDIAMAFFASVAVPFGFSIIIRFRDMFFNQQFGIYMVFYALICALGTDAGAQLGGMAFGKHKMSPNISPKKTIEGAACGIIVSLILNAVAFTIYNRLASFPIDASGATILFAACIPISFMGMMGDLTASVLKRNFDVKDFGNIFPGHGGIMDRFDSSLFTLPLTYILVFAAFC